jgi:hypothetical protein
MGYLSCHLKQTDYNILLSDVNDNLSLICIIVRCRRATMLIGQAVPD